MAESNNMALSEDQKAYLANMQEVAQKLGLDPNNDVHLEAAQATLNQMNKFQITQEDNAQSAAQKGQEKLAIATTLGLDGKALEAQAKQAETDAVGLQKGLKTKGIINAVLSLGASIGAAFLTNNFVKSKNWKPVGRWAANIGVFLAAGAGMAQLGDMLLGKPTRTKLQELSNSIQVAETEFDKKLVTAMAQHFVKEITDERAHVAAALKPTEPAKQEAPHQQPEHHDQPHAANTHEKPAHEHHEKTAAEHEMEAAIRKERHEANAALDGAAPHHNEHADHGKAPHHDSFVEKEKNIPATPPVNGIAPTNVMDRVTQPHENHLAAAEAAKAAAATQQHGVGAY